MVEEGGVDGGDFDLGHVAGDAVGFGLGADFWRGVGVRVGCGCGGRVARQAFCVVGRGVLIELFVRIVAGDAGEARVACGVAPALAVFEAVGLEADVHHVGEFLFAEDDVGPGAVTCAAEIHRCSCIEAARIEDGGAALLDFSGLHRGDVIGSGAVTGFALHAGSEMRRVEMAGDAGGGGVAAEAAARFVGVEPAAHRRFEVAGSGGVMAGGEIERLQ